MYSRRPPSPPSPPSPPPHPQPPLRVYSPTRHLQLTADPSPSNVSPSLSTNYDITGHTLSAGSSRAAFRVAVSYIRVALTKLHVGLKVFQILSMIYGASYIAMTDNKVWGILTWGWIVLPIWCLAFFTFLIWQIHRIGHVKLFGSLIFIVSVTFLVLLNQYPIFNVQSGSLALLPLVITSASLVVATLAAFAVFLVALFRQSRQTPGAGSDTHMV